MNQLPIIIENCNGCSACCNHGWPPFEVLINERGELVGPDVVTVNALPDDLRLEYLAVVRGVANGTLPDRRAMDLPCYWLDEHGLCKHYELRPAVCRDFETGSTGCRTYRRRAGLPR